MANIGLKGLAGTLAVVLSIGFGEAAWANFEGFGSDIPLSMAAQKIVPEGTSVNYGAGVDQATEISWKASSDWQQALSSAVAKKGYKAEFSEGSVTIVKAEGATSRPYSSAPSKDAVQKRSTNTGKKRAVANAPKPRETRQVVENNVPQQGGGGFVIRPYHAPSAANATSNVSVDKSTTSGHRLEGKEIVDGKDWKPVGNASGTYIVEEGYMLRQTVNTWAEAAGWKVVWDSDHDYVIEAHAEFKGDFVSASSQLFQAMKDARPAITVVYHKGNQVLVVSNNSSDAVN